MLFSCAETHIKHRPAKSHLFLWCSVDDRSEAVFDQNCVSLEVAGPSEGFVLLAKHADCGFLLCFFVCMVFSSSVFKCKTFDNSHLHKTLYC